MGSGLQDGRRNRGREVVRVLRVSRSENQFADISDGLHLNEKGYRPVTEAVQAIVVLLFEAKDPSEKGPDKWSQKGAPTVPTVDLPT